MQETCITMVSEKTTTQIPRTGSEIRFWLISATHLLLEYEGNRLALVEIESKTNVVEYTHPHQVDIIAGSNDLSTVVIYDQEQVMTTWYPFKNEVAARAQI